MSTPIDIDGRLQRNLTWQILTDPDRQELSKALVIIGEGAVLRRCVDCCRAMLRHAHVRIAGEETVECDASCGNLEAA